uniref:Homogentisate phytyltransferase n=1 Tax=Eucampia antarctica TaxID=49252 RepID=A0A7S2R0V2_9STRA
MTVRVNGDSSVVVVEDQKSLPFWKVLWRFTRPHTIIGSAMAIPALHLFAAPTFQAAFQPAVLRSIVFAMFPSLLMNLYITGLNQITDVDIDKVNKPQLPMASGDLSPTAANWIVSISLLVSLAWGMSHPVLGTQGLNVALWGSMLLGTLYSLPPFRLKRFPFLAAFCIVSVRGAVINAGFFAHAQAAAFGGSIATTTVWNCLCSDPRCLLSSLFFAVFGLVIALMKDVPDYTGDALFNIRSFTVRAGPKTIFHSMRRLLTTAFLAVGAIFARSAFQALSSNNNNPTLLMASRILVSASSIAAGISVHKRSNNVDPENSTQTYSYYMHLWKLFYLSYFVLPFVR